MRFLCRCLLVTAFFALCGWTPPVSLAAEDSGFMIEQTLSERDKAREERLKERDKAEYELRKLEHERLKERERARYELQRERDKAEFELRKERLKYEQERSRERNGQRADRRRGIFGNTDDTDDDDDESNDDDDDDARWNGRSRRRDLDRGVDREFENHFRSTDRDGNGVISRREWPRTDGSFDRYDRNRDGVLTRSEISAAAVREGSRN